MRLPSPNFIKRGKRVIKHAFGNYNVTIVLICIMNRSLKGYLLSYLRIISNSNHTENLLIYSEFTPHPRHAIKSPLLAGSLTDAPTLLICSQWDVLNPIHPRTQQGRGYEGGQGGSCINESIKGALDGGVPCQ